MRNKIAKIIRKIALSGWESFNDQEQSYWTKKSEPFDKQQSKWNRKPRLCGNGLKCFYRHLKKRGKL